MCIETVLEHGLQALLELAAVFGPGDERSQVERDDPFVFEPFWDITTDDALRQPLDDRGLADTWFADQHRVVLGLTRHDLDGPTDLRVPADYWLQPPRSRLCYKITTVLAECLLRPLRRC